MKKRELLKASACIEFGKSEKGKKIESGLENNYGGTLALTH